MRFFRVFVLAFGAMTRVGSNNKSSLALMFFFAVSVGGCSNKTLPPAHSFTPFDTNNYIKSPYGIDDRGILYFDYGDRYGGIGKYANPTFVAAYANALYRDYISGESAAKEEFIKQADYLVSTARESGAAWEYPFENKHFNAPVGWYSGMTSGRVLSVLVRAHAITNDKKYLDFASKVFDRLSKPMVAGGMATYTPEGLWIEEVAFEGLDSFGVLNGHIYGLAGVFDYEKYTGSANVRNFRDSAVAKVLNEIDSFDSGFLSYYCSRSPTGSRYFAEKGGYNLTHVSQLLYLYSETGNVIFLKKAMQFYGYEVFSPIIDASFSTNVKTHGPEKMNFAFGNSYWSSYQFPVDVEYTFENMETLLGMVVLGHTELSTPKDLYVEVWDGESWQGVAKELNNSTQRLEIKFSYPVKARRVRISIFSDNGNNSVALDGVGFYRATLGHPVIDFNNFTVGMAKLFDGDHSTGHLIRNDGYFIIPKSSNSNVIEVYGELSGLKKLAAYSSRDLIVWEPVDVERLNDKVVIKKNYSEYYKLEFKQNQEFRINEILF